jgi:hypothetical protein
VVAEDDFLSIFHCISTQFELSALELLAAIAYKLWLRKNLFVFGGQILPPIVWWKAQEKFLVISRGQDLQHLSTDGTNWEKAPNGQNH